MEAIRGIYQPRNRTANYIHVGSYLDDNLHDWLCYEAERQHISRSHLIVRALRLYQEAQRIYEERKKQNEITNVFTVELHQR